MAAATAEIWRDVFTNWPAGVPRHGIVVSALNEPIPFKSYFIKGQTLLLERTNPDPMGTRFVLLPFEEVHLLKLIDPLKESVLTAAGYTGKLAKA